MFVHMRIMQDELAVAGWSQPANQLIYDPTWEISIIHFINGMQWDGENW